MKKLVPIFLLLSGCSLIQPQVSEPAKQLNEQNRQAGELLSKNDDPKISSVGKDIQSNSEQIQKEIGPPKVVIPYSPEASARAREEHEQAPVQSPLLDAFQFVIPYLPGAAGGIVAALIAYARQRRNWRKLVATYEGVDKVIEKVKQDKGISPEAVVDAIKSVHTAWGVYTDVRDDLRALKKQ